MEANQLQAKDLRLKNLIYFSDESKNVKNARATVTGIEDDEMVKFTAVNITDNSTEKIISISQNTIEGWGELCQFSGIPLTQDIRVNLGFKNNELIAGHLMFIWLGDHLGIKGMLGLVKPSNCKFVHQLQNLYHSLTGEELTFKN